MKFRRIARGNHSFREDGQLKTVQYGEIIDVEDPELLGTDILGYVPVNSKMDLNQTALQLETDRHVYMKREKSQWLNEQFKPDGQKMFVQLKDLRGLLLALENITDDGLASRHPGSLQKAKSRLSDAWANWQLECDNDPLKKLDPTIPRDKHFEAIAELQARIIVLEAEAEKIEELIEKAMVPEEEVKDDRIERLRYSGIYRCNSDREIIECDGREIVQNEDDVPVFADDGSSVHDYLELCKVEKRKKHLEIRRKANLRKRRRAKS